MKATVCIAVPFKKKTAGGGPDGDEGMRLPEIGGVAVTAFGDRGRAARHLAGTAAAIANLAVPADNVGGVRTAVVAAALEARGTAAAGAALARFRRRTHALIAARLPS